MRDRKSYIYVRRKAKVKTSVGPLVDADRGVMVTGRCISEQFNKFFVSVFTKKDSSSGNASLADRMYKGLTEERLCNTEITDGIMVKQLERLRDNKAAGADELASRFLNRIKGGISYPFTLFFLKIMFDE